MRRKFGTLDTSQSRAIKRHGARRMSAALHAMARAVVRGMVQMAAIAALSLSALSVTLSPVLAQNMFAPVAYVNDKVVTRYELTQRLALLRVLGGAASEKDALDALIDERLKAEAAARVGLSVTDEQIAQGIQEFAARGQLKPEQFLSLMAQNGVSAQTVRDFLSTGLIWRQGAGLRLRD